MAAGASYPAGWQHLRDRLKPAFQRFHPRQTEADAFKARVDLAIGRSGEREQRTTLRLAAVKRGEHGTGVEAELADRLCGGGRATVSIAGQAFDEGNLTRFDAGKAGGFGQRGADLVDRAGRFARRIGDGFTGLLVIGQRTDHLLDEVLPLFEVSGDLVEIAAVFADAAFGAGDLRLAVKQGQPVASRGVLRDRHGGHRHQPGNQQGERDCGSNHLQTRGNLDETDLSLRPHEEFAVREPCPQAILQTASGSVVQGDPVCTQLLFVAAR